MVLCLTLLEHLLPPKQSQILQVLCQATPAQWSIWHSLWFRCQLTSQAPEGPFHSQKREQQIKCNFTSEPNTSFSYQEAEQLGRKFKPLDHFIRSIFLFMSRINNSSFGPNLWDTSQLSMYENELLRKTPICKKMMIKSTLVAPCLFCVHLCGLYSVERQIEGMEKSTKKFICPVQC